MVRKQISCMLLLLALSCALSCNAAALDIYDNGTISSTYTTMFTGLANKLSPLDDYVFCRSGQYTYTLAYGDLNLNGASFSGSDITLVTLTTNTGYNSTYTYTTTTQGSFSLNAGNNLVYSNLGNYPLLGEVVSYDYIQTLLFCVFALCVFIRPVFNFVLRNKQ